MPQIAKGSEEFLVDGTCKVTRQSRFSGKETTMVLPITKAQFVFWKHGGALIQEAMPHLTPDQREFMMTGTTQEEWDRMFPEDE